MAIHSNSATLPEAQDPLPHRSPLCDGPATLGCEPLLPRKGQEEGKEINTKDAMCWELVCIICSLSPHSH